MARFLLQVSYTAEGSAGLLKDGGTKRRQIVKGLIERLGGKLELFEYALGETDVYLVVDLPDNATAAAVSIVVAASGGARVRSVPLVSPEEIDQATKKQIAYSPPGK